MPIQRRRALLPPPAQTAEIMMSASAQLCPVSNVCRRPKECLSARARSPGGECWLVLTSRERETAVFIHLSFSPRRLKLHRSCVTLDSEPSPGFGSAAAPFDALAGCVCACLPFDTIYRTSRQQRADGPNDKTRMGGASSRGRLAQGGRALVSLLISVH